jgi:hypothetical protein
MSIQLYRKFRADLLEVCDYWRAEHPGVAERYLIPRLRRQMVMLRGAYFRGEAY